MAYAGAHVFYLVQNKGVPRVQLPSEVDTRAVFCLDTGLVPVVKDVRISAGNQDEVARIDAVREWVLIQPAAMPH